MMRKLAIAVVAALVAGGGAAAATESSVPFAPARPAADQPRGHWWTALGDPALNGLEDRLAAASPSLRLAVLRYDQARAYLGLAASDQSPRGDLVGSGTENRQSNLRPLRGSNQPDQYAANTIGAVMSYEIDLWGRVRREVAAGRAEVAARQDDLESVRLSLQAELAVDYARLRAADDDIALLTSASEAYGRVYHLIEVRHTAGAASAVDLARADSQRKSVLAQADDARAARALYEHAIAVLVGDNPRTFRIPATMTRLKLVDPPVAVESTLLERRPDIAAAEARVAEANALIGVARAAFFPQLSLGAALGVQNTGEAGLFASSNRFWSVGPAADLSFLDGGRRRAGLQLARTQRDAAVESYRQTVLTAFQDVEDNIALIARLGDEAAHQSDAVAAARQAESLSIVRYQKGAVTFLETAVAETTALQADRVYLQVEERRLEAGIRLVKALGGDWRPGGRADPQGS